MPLFFLCLSGFIGVGGDGNVAAVVRRAVLPCVVLGPKDRLLVDLALDLALGIGIGIGSCVLGEQVVALDAAALVLVLLG
mmetsp:Transcript_27690/g.34412  ORF Transcript_27690/g.34412 Transcript_27690/m.34412 type:complete len:80 (+) Transcript_27690:1745-1984(+)